MGTGAPQPQSRSAGRSRLPASRRPHDRPTNVGPVRPVDAVRSGPPEPAAVVSTVVSPGRAVVGRAVVPPWSPEDVNPRRVIAVEIGRAIGPGGSAGAIGRREIGIGIDR